MSVTIEDLTLKTIIPDLDSLPLLQKLRNLHFDTTPEICTELPRLMTRYLKKEEEEEVVPGDSPELRAGRMNKYILENKQAIILDDDLLAGTTTTKKKGVVLYPDILATMSIWPELETISRRPKNRFNITKKEIKELNQEIFPYWLKRGTLLEAAREAPPGNPWCLQVMERIVFFVATKVNVISHTIPNYAAVVDQGLNAIRKDAQDLENDTNDQEKKAFYQAVQLSLQGILSYAHNLSLRAAEMAQVENDPDRRKELEKMSEVCSRVPAQKPTSFREAVNALWICEVALHQETVNIALSPGRLDQVLYPAFRDDLERSRKPGGEGERAFLREAVELVGCLWLKICDHVPVAPEASEQLFGGSGSNQAVTLGGIDREGNDAVNDLTYVMLRATELLGLRDPNVNARYHPDKNTLKYLQRLCEVNISTGATPCFHNDISAIKALKGIHKGQGVSELKALEDARDYGSVGCVEPSSAGRTFGHTGAIMMNLPAALELALFQGKHRLTEDEKISEETPDPQDMRSFAEFQQAFKTQLAWLIDQAVTLNNNLGEIYQQRHPFPMMSALMEGCLKKGKDVIQGGAEYNSSGAGMIGLAEVVDSLTAIEEFVFGTGPDTVSFPEMIQAINSNWEGNESHKKLQEKIKKFPDKFGTNGPRAKEHANWLIRFLHYYFQGKENYRGGKYTVGYWTMTMHAGFGALSRALPSGRKDKESFPSGITPVSGAAPDLPEVLHFVADLDPTFIANGQALNLKFLPGIAAPNYAHCIEAFFRMGGLQVQSNIIDADYLRSIKEHPEVEHPPLMVRVSGYSAYFQDLNPKMQDEIITRTEYDLKC